MSSSATWNAKHRSVTATLTNDEYDAFIKRAQARGLKPTPLVSQIVREFLAQPDTAPLAPDDFEQAEQVYSVGETAGGE